MSLNKSHKLGSKIRFIKQFLYRHINIERNPRLQLKIIIQLLPPIGKGVVPQLNESESLLWLKFPPK